MASAGLRLIHNSPACTMAARLYPAMTQQFSCLTLNHSRGYRSLRSFPNHVYPPVNKTQPDFNRFPHIPKVPEAISLGREVPKGTKDLRRFFGEENTHTELVLKQFAVVAISGGQLRWKHFDTFRKYFNSFLTNESFVLLRVDAPYRPQTSKSGKRMGGGKGKVKTHGSVVKAGRVIFEVGGKVTWEECAQWMENVARKLPFEAIAISHETLEALKVADKKAELANTNPYTIEWFLRNNIMDCRRYFSPYDLKFGGKFTYKDRHNNRKWDMARQEPYPFNVSHK